VHPEHEGLFAAGLAQANGSMWRLADYQGRLIANLIVAGRHAPERARHVRSLLASHAAAGARTFVASDRHRLEVNYYDYRRLLLRVVRRFGPVRGMRFDPGPSHAETGVSSRSLRAAR
jgi:hypothetical protein